MAAPPNSAQEIRFGRFILQPARRVLLADGQPVKHGARVPEEDVDRAATAAALPMPLPALRTNLPERLPVLIGRAEELAALSRPRPR